MASMVTVSVQALVEADVPLADRYEDNDAAYDAWFRAKVQESLDDPRPSITHEEMRRRMEGRRAAVLESMRK